MLKPIPQEQPDPQNLANQIARSVRKTINQKKHFVLAPKLHQKMGHQKQKEKKFLHVVHDKMVTFLSKQKKHTHEEMSDMILHLQKSVLSLQREQHKMIWLDQKKRKGKQFN